MFLGSHFQNSSFTINPDFSAQLSHVTDISTAADPSSESFWEVVYQSFSHKSFLALLTEVKLWRVVIKGTACNSMPFQSPSRFGWPDLKYHVKLNANFASWIFSASKLWNLIFLVFFQHYIFLFSLFWDIYIGWDFFLNGLALHIGWARGALTGNIGFGFHSPPPIPSFSKPQSLFTFVQTILLPDRDVIHTCRLTWDANFDQNWLGSFLIKGKWRRCRH